MAQGRQRRAGAGTGAAAPYPARCRAFVRSRREVGIGFRHEQGEVEGQAAECDAFVGLETSFGLGGDEQPRFVAVAIVVAGAWAVVRIVIVVMIARAGRGVRTALNGGVPVHSRKARVHRRAKGATAPLLRQRGDTDGDDDEDGSPNVHENGMILGLWVYGPGWPKLRRAPGPRS